MARSLSNGGSSRVVAREIASSACGLARSPSGHFASTVEAGVSDDGIFVVVGNSDDGIFVVHAAATTAYQRERVARDRTTNQATTLDRSASTPTVFPAN